MRWAQGFVMGLFCALIGLIISFPLAWIGPLFIPNNIAPDARYSGSVWDGTIQNIPDIGSVNIKSSWQKFFTGKSFFTLTSKSAALQFQGQGGFSGFGNVQASGLVAGLSHLEPRLSGVTGTFNLNLSDLEFSDKCKAASGNVSTNFLQQNTQLWRWKGPELNGPITCEDGNIVANISGQDRDQTIQALIVVDLAGTYQATIEVQTRQEEAAAILPLFGFNKTVSGFRLVEQQTWR